MLSLATATMTVGQNNPNVPYATGPTNRPADSVVSSTQQLMCKPMQILQLNMQKRREVQHSVMNDASLQGYTALAISEPYVFESEGEDEPDGASELDGHPAEPKARRTLGGTKHAMGTQGHRV